jgi:predicted AlkP superfamily phosphohydrolase/phosphomutase/O-antigen/teichoic acid export membrane protein
VTDLNRQLSKGALYVSLGQAAFLLSGYALQMILARLLAPSSFGVFVVVMNVLVWIEITVNNGVPSALQKFLPDQSWSEASVRQAAARCQVLISLVVFAALFAAAPLLAQLLRDPSLTAYLRLAFVDILAMGAYAYYRGVLNGWRAFRQLAATITAYALTKLLISSLLVYLGFGVQGALIGNVASSLGGLAVGFLWIRRRPTLSGEARPLNGLNERQILAFVLPTILFTLASNVLLGLDLMGVKALLADANQVGYYGAAVKLAEAPRLVLLAFSFTLLPSLSHAIAAGNEALTRSYLQQTIRLLALALLPLLALVTATAGPLVTLVFSAPYRAAAPILTVLIFVYAIYTVYITLISALLAENRPGRALAIPLALLPVAFAAVWLGVSRVGVMGAAFASLLSVTSAAVVVVVYVLRRFRPAIGIRSLGRIALASAIIWALARWWSPSGLLLLLAWGLLGGLYLALLLILGSRIWSRLVVGCLIQGKSEGRSMEQSGRKAIILGLDGATFDVLLPRVERGLMPNLTALLRDGVWGELQSTVPPFSAQAWVSMATGQNQARHGVVDFWEAAPDHVRRSFVTTRQVHSETLWQIAGRHSRRVGVVNVPVTYPPQPVNGYLVSGFLTPQGRADYTYPLALRDEILALIPDYEPDPFDPVGASKRQILEIESWMRKHERLARHLAGRETASLFFSVVQALDHLQHLFWNDIVGGQGNGEFADLVDGCYCLADEIIGHRRQMMDERTTLFLVSDHGFGPATKWFHVNRFLLERGLLSLGQAGGGLGGPLARLGLTPQAVRTAVRRLDVWGVRRRLGRLARVTLGRRIDQALIPPIDWGQTRAVSGSPATEGIFLNVKGREPQGTVEPGQEYEALRHRLIAELTALRDPETRQPVVRAVHRREDLYDGPFLDLLPDVVFDLGDGPYLASDALSAERMLEPLPAGYLQGRHRSRGILVAAGADVEGGKQIEGARIVDVAPTVLYALGLPIPRNMDGRPLLEIWGAGQRAIHPVQYAEPELAPGPAGDPSYDQDDAAEMERRLRGLGYVS